MAGLLEDKVGVVTGAGSGIGRDCAMRMAREGASVMCADINLDAAMGTVEAITDAGGTARAIEIDVADSEKCKLMVEATIDAFGVLHLAVNNAGIGGEAALTGEYTVEGWRKVISINLDGVFYSMRYELPEIVKSGGGSVVNISSILGLVGWATACAYTSAKHGVVGLTQVAAIEYAPMGVRVNSVNPGFIETPLLTSAGIVPGNEIHAMIAGKHAMNRLGSSVEIANAVTWLLSEEASYVTGTAFPVDGGYTCQ